MKVAVLLYREKQRLFETFSLSANSVAEFVNHLVDNTQGQLQKVYQIRGAFSCK